MLQLARLLPTPGTTILPAPSPSVLISMSSAFPLISALPSHARISILHLSFPSPPSVIAPYPAHFRPPPSPNILTPSACAPPPQLALRRPYPFLATRRCQVPFSNLFVSFPRLAKPSFPPLAFRPHIHLKPRSSDPCLAIHTCMAILHLSCRSPPFGIRGSAHYGAFFFGGESEP